ncbi:P7 [Mycoreovirus 1]|uniref:Uncharacterized protein VP7 n=1 Tax=Cryphonectria parasitica mycoreovirus 1 (strain 9B21) TaxID=230407 RepID=VP7_MYRV9|nr:P7 [Mycoreovirus 1]Q65YU9.1 RecName: Full=Uncharacterized protein VP7 [Cryphonectria parasitica mycoreovirus 1]BAD51417.1 P7 [Cryphonectria parasitica mycoreovirus 1]
MALTIYQHSSSLTSHLQTVHQTQVQFRKFVGITKVWDAQVRDKKLLALAHTEIIVRLSDPSAIPKLESVRIASGHINHPSVTFVTDPEKCPLCTNPSVSSSKSLSDLPTSGVVLKLRDLNLKSPLQMNDVILETGVTGLDIEAHILGRHYPHLAIILLGGVEHLVNIQTTTLTQHYQDLTLNLFGTTYKAGYLNSLRTISSEQEQPVYNGPGIRTLVPNGHVIIPNTPPPAQINQAASQGVITYQQSRDDNEDPFTTHHFRPDDGSDFPQSEHTNVPALVLSPSPSAMPPVESSNTRDQQTNAASAFTPIEPESRVADWSEDFDSAQMDQNLTPPQPPAPASTPEDTDSTARQPQVTPTRVPNTVTATSASTPASTSQIQFGDRSPVTMTQHTLRAPPPPPQPTNRNITPDFLRPRPTDVPSSNFNHLAILRNPTDQALTDRLNALAGLVNAGVLDPQECREILQTLKN